MLAFFIATIFYLSSPSKISNLLITFKSKFVVQLLAIFLILNIMGFIPGLIHLTLDFTIAKAYLLVLFLLLVSMYLYPILVVGVVPEKRFYFILKLLVSVFLIQSCVEIFAFVNPVVKGIVSFFQKDLVAEKDMGGIRALALTGNPFFDLAAGFGLIFIVFVFKITMNGEKEDYFSVKNSLFFIVLFVGSFFAGRTAFVGLGVALVLYFLSLGARLKKAISFIRLVLIVAGISYLLYNILLPSEIKEIVENQLLPFVFEAVYNYIDTGETSTKSGEILQQMYFPISWQTFLVGDGKYTGDDGGYYMHSDAGIMRNILFYGIFGLLFILFGHLFYFFKPLGRILPEMKRGISVANVNKLLFFLSLLLYTLALQYKGEVLLFMPIIQVLLFYICFSFLERAREV
ncbi:hypothetical protein SPPR111872_22995 [Sphingobacterium prati]